MKRGADIAQWICLRFPSCRPRFESQAHHLLFLKKTYMNMHMKAHRPQDMDEGPFLVQVMIFEWQLGQTVWQGSTPKPFESKDGEEDFMIASLRDPISEIS